MSRLTITTLATLLALPVLAQADEPAPNPGKRAVAVAAQRDSLKNQQAAASLTLPVGQRAWVNVGAGTSRSQDATRTYRPTQVSAGVGVAGSAWQATLDASRRRDGSALHQTDWAAAADVRPVDGVSVGVDATHRTARARNATTEQRLRGRGVGVHGAVAVGQHLTVHGAMMRNRYKVSETTTQTGSSGALGLLLQPRPSVVNRDELALARSAQVGATWRFDNQVAVTGEVLRDRLQDGGSLRTAQLKAAVPVGGGWTLAPAIGRSHGPQRTRATYGQLGASFAW
ncbi:hypothetical protein [Roseateles sp. LYH14W]|uniref:Autotransporter outer membrane beta-barrel domain-containing protein n=1 Tax=Pelomonas parva TaxID=3299032 RepID=A0ABW7F048_9BURK